MPVPFDDAIASAKNGADLDVDAALDEFLAQAMDKYFEGVGGRAIVASEQLPFEQFLGHNTPGLSCQEFKYLRLARRQYLKPPIDKGLRVGRVESQVDEPPRAFIGHHIADATNGADLNFRATLGEPLAQPMDINVDSIGGGTAFAPEQLSFDQYLGQNPPLSPYQ